MDASSETTRPITRHLAALIDQMPIGIFLLDAAGKVADASAEAARACGRERPDALAGLDFWKSDATKAIAAGLDRAYAFSSREAFDCEAPSAADGASGTRFDLRVVPLSVSPDGGEALLVILLDPAQGTGGGGAQFQSEKLSALASIVAGVSHELNNPLTSIMGYSELLLSYDKLPAPHHARLVKITEEAERCRKIVKNLLAFSEQHGKPAEFFCVNGLLEETTALRSYQMRVDGIEILFDLDPSAPKIPAEPHELGRAFLNIINNAHQALLQSEKSSRTLRIASKLDNGLVRITFSDNGPGIPEEIVNKVFDPFFTTHKFGEGMGLGLSAAYGTIRDHQGHIAIAPTEGGGCTIRISLPVSAETD